VHQLLGIVGKDTDQGPKNALALVPSVSKALTEALDTARSLSTEVSAMSDNLSDVAEQQEDADRRLRQLEDWLRLP